ncbi:hypothetical protein ACUH9Y_02510 [Dermabacteraceae bacterium P13115]
MITLAKRKTDLFIILDTPIWGTTPKWYKTILTRKPSSARPKNNFVARHISSMERRLPNKAPTPPTAGSGSNNSGDTVINNGGTVINNYYGGEHHHHYAATTSPEPSFGSQPPRDEEPDWQGGLRKLVDTVLAKVWANLRSEIASWLADRLLGSLIWFGVVCVGAGGSAVHELGGFWPGIIRASMKVVLLLMQ